MVQTKIINSKGPKFLMSLESRNASTIRFIFSNSNSWKYHLETIFSHKKDKLQLYLINGLDVLVSKV